MFTYVYQRFQRATFFEKLLLVVGISIGILGFWLINTAYYKEPTLSWQFIMSIFLWLLLIFVVILTDSNESIKEELSIIIKEHIDETKLLREEVKLLNANLSRKGRK
ncbi:hypothetical protein J4458_05490 [Candidatus Woesearchaeota archaeon]|nr:hypothetical protein [Candidatus Woesearchaeota archaeon]